LTWVVGYIPRWFTSHTDTHPSSKHLMATQLGVKRTTA